MSIVPMGGIIRNVLSNGPEFMFIANNVFVVIPLPVEARKSILAAKCGDGSFICPDDNAERSLSG